MCNHNPNLLLSLSMNYTIVICEEWLNIQNLRKGKHAIYKYCVSMAIHSTFAKGAAAWCLLTRNAWRNYLSCCEGHCIQNNFPDNQNNVMKVAPSVSFLTCLTGNTKEKRKIQRLMEIKQHQSFRINIDIYTENHQAQSFLLKLFFLFFQLSHKVGIHITSCPQRKE